MKLRALVVEDDPDQLDGLEIAFRSISEIERRRYGIDGISVEKADCAQVAREKLEEASRLGQPFDILLQDLNLPTPPKGEEEGVWIGLGLLEFAHDKKAAKEIGVVSVNTDFDSVSTAFLRGAVDFIPKPYKTKDLPGRILQLWERRVMKESARVFEDRLKTLIPFARLEFINQINSHLSNVVQTILREAEGMKRGFSERFGIDAQNDSQDPLLEHLAAMKQAAIEAQEECVETSEVGQGLFKKYIPVVRQPQAQLVVPPDIPNDKFVLGFIEDILQEVVEAVSSCLTVKRVDVKIKIPEERKTQVISFGQDVRTVLSEIILGGISRLPDQNNLSKDIIITVDKTEKDGKAAVRFVDNLDPIPVEKATAINTGESLKPDDDLGRAWGLSVVHHVALRGGGHLSVESSGQGNVVTYFIPLAQNA